MLEQNCPHESQEAEEEMTRVKACPSDNFRPPISPHLSSLLPVPLWDQPFNTQAIQTMEMKRGEGVGGAQGCRCAGANPALRQALRQPYLLTLSGLALKFPGPTATSLSQPTHNSFAQPTAGTKAGVLVSPAASCDGPGSACQDWPSYLGCFPQNRLLWGDEIA